MVLHSQCADGKGGHGITLTLGWTWYYTHSVLMMVGVDMVLHCVVMVRVDMVLHSQCADGKGGHGITLTVC